MRSKKYLWDVCVKIYIKMFKESTPSLDFQKLLDEIKNGKKLEEEWFMDYYLPQKRQNEITNEICKEHKITRIEKGCIDFTVNLGCAPKGIK